MIYLFAYLAGCFVSNLFCRTAEQVGQRHGGGKMDTWQMIILTFGYPILVFVCIILAALLILGGFAANLSHYLARIAVAEEPDATQQ